ncbi:MAG: tRNA (N(6)-L-threonylcarbamoyladenosine(37)-C(2))-methylthiotransferase MtaB [Thermodesulfobacteriaceae bacterium]|nr:tRNA (N(6)-L-threonylcarbamoyladenosine(37)-C(2))-methylthiotransferase MtaB [Thermodesulfobacteriaceae bacterium]MDW8135658.1 tRNA (N(6)-L-threonylcarbamoyladenosine(37)-C(2))-methylthiotransferase MtaB [Thermodesulfobacterium sp.]
MKPIRFFVKTLGCKVNQVESAFMVETLSKEGFILSEERTAQIFILNSCAVTHKATQESRKLVKRWKKFNPQLIVITGCYAQVYPQEILNWAKKEEIENLVILGHKEKFEIAYLLRNFFDLESENRSFIKISNPKEFTKFEDLFIEDFFQHSRAFVKIQDGCNQFCSYCLVPYARGKSRSLPIKQVLKQIETFIEKGYEEILLTGIHLGNWGEDLVPRQKLVELLWQVEKFLSQFKGEFILRLSSLEVTEIGEDFLEFAKHSHFLAPHFHIPLQSGSNKILKLMNRTYTSEFYLRVLEKLYQLFPQATFGADVIVGFPEEEEKDFEDTVKVVKNSPLNWLHIFPFSFRPGTLAEKKWSPKVPSWIVENRKKILQNLILNKRKAFLESEKGKIRKAVIESLENQNLLKGLTENYIEVKTKTENPNSNFLIKKVVKIKLLEVKDLYFTGDLIHTLTKSQP